MMVPWKQIDRNENTIKSSYWKKHLIENFLSCQIAGTLGKVWYKLQSNQVKRSTQNYMSMKIEPTNVVFEECSNELISEKLFQE